MRSGRSCLSGFSLALSPSDLAPELAKLILNFNINVWLGLVALIYSAVTFVGMALYGVDAWIDRGEAFSVYFNLFSRISPIERRGRRIGLRKPLSGLTALELTVLAAGFMLGGTVGLGTVVFALGIGPIVQWSLGVFDPSGLVIRRRRANLGPAPAVILEGPAE